MSLKNRIRDDVHRVFLNPNHFAETHTWNGHAILCVVDEDYAQKIKSLNVLDLSWDSNTSETAIYVAVDGFPERLQPNLHVLFDERDMRIIRYSESGGMYTIILISEETRSMR